MCDVTCGPGKPSILFDESYQFLRLFLRFQTERYSFLTAHDFISLLCGGYLRGTLLNLSHIGIVMAGKANMLCRVHPRGKDCTLPATSGVTFICSQRWLSAGSMLGQRRRRWPSIGPALNRVFCVYRADL